MPPCLVKRADERADATAWSDDGIAVAGNYGIKHALDVEVERRDFVGGQGLAVDVSARRGWCQARGKQQAGA